MWLDWTIAKLGYFRGALWRLATTRTPTAEKRFIAVFGAECMGEGQTSLIKMHLKKLAENWRVADKNFRVVYENLEITLANPSGGAGFDLRERHQQLEFFNEIRRRAWNALDEACMLPSKVGCTGISTDPLSYLEPGKTNGVRLIETPQGRLPISWDKKKN